MKIRDKIGKEISKQSGLVIKVYGIEIARDRHFAQTKNVLTSKNTKMKIIFTSGKMDFAKIVVPKALTSSVRQGSM